MNMEDGPSGSNSPKQKTTTVEYAMLCSNKTINKQTYFHKLINTHQKLS